jgi:hypothetical protein
LRERPLDMDEIPSNNHNGVIIEGNHRSKNIQTDFVAASQHILISSKFNETQILKIVTKKIKLINKGSLVD